MEPDHEQFMREAIKLSVDNVDNKGGPFGAIIVKNGKVISYGANKVTVTNDPTAHAEIIAIREAAKNLKNYNLSGCDIYTSCEPCPMCLSAIYWARIDRIFYGNTKTDAKNIGFDDSFIYDEIALPLEKRKIKTTQLLRDEAIEGFRKWDRFEGKVEY
jgi:tRNA(Arg) A34 adenosine deaminase TadA